MLILFVLSLFVILLGFNTNSTSAMGQVNQGCMVGDMYSRTTGQACEHNTTPVDCRTGDLFSSVTGQRCTAWQDNTNGTVPDTLFKRELTVGSRGEDVKALQQILKSAGFLLGKIDGAYGPITKGAVVKYQTDNGITATGKVDTDTLREIKLIPWYKMCPLINSTYGVSYPCPPAPTTSNDPIISGVSGPQSLNVNQNGTWTVMASSSNGGNLSYSVVWGDETTYANLSGSVSSTEFKQSATFTHNYSQSGSYIPTFTVTNEKGQSATTSLSVNVGNGTSNLISEQVKCVFNGSTIEEKCVGLGSYATIASGLEVIPRYLGCSGIESCVANVSGPKGMKLTWTSSCSDSKSPITTIDGESEYINFNCNNNSPSVTVLRPNGGETFNIGDAMNITYQASNFSINDWFRINLVQPGTSNSATQIAAFQAEKNSSSYSWVIPSTIIPGSNYEISVDVCRTTFGTLCEGGVTDYSNAPFTIARSQTKVSPCSHYGDVNNDGYVNDQDITIIQDGILVKSPLSADQKILADVNNSGTVSSLDLVYISRYILGLDATFPVCSAQ